MSATGPILRPVLQPALRSVFDVGVGGGGQPIYPLDVIEGGPPLAAYATVKLREAYAGPAVRVVRPSDGATLDVGFVLDGLDVESVSSFLGSETGQVDLWYDQSGNGLHASQSTAALRPMIEPDSVAGGPIAMGGKRALVFNASALELPSGLSVQRRSLNAVCVAEQFASVGTQSALFQVGSGTSQVSVFMPANTTGGRFIQVNPGGNSTFRTQSRPLIYETRVSAANAIVSQGAESHAAAAPAEATMSGGFIGNTALSGGYQGKFYATAFIFWGRDLGSDRDPLRGSLNALHGINEAPSARVVFAGDSITIASSNVSPHHFGYSKIAARMLPQTHLYNVGGGGQQLQNMLANYPTQIGNILSAYSDNRIVFLAYGTNDINVGSRTDVQLYADLQTECANIRGSGGKVIVATVLPATGFDTTREGYRLAYNAAVRENWPAFADGIADFASDPVMGAPGAPVNAALYPDGMHPSRLGHSYLAPIAAAAINALL